MGTLVDHWPWCETATAPFVVAAPNRAQPLVPLPPRPLYYFLRDFTVGPPSYSCPLPVLPFTFFMGRHHPRHPPDVSPTVLIGRLPPPSRDASKIGRAPCRCFLAQTSILGVVVPRGAQILGGIDSWVGSAKGGTTAAATAAAVATAAPSGGGGGGCLDCLQDVVRALSMGSCLTAEQRPASAANAAPWGKEGEGRRREEELPGRIAGNGVGNAACLFTRQGRKGTNQDAMVVWENFNGRADTVFCGVFDGHGPHGHIVARKVRDTLPSKLRDLIYDDYGESPISNSDSSILEETLSPYADAEDKSPMSGQKQEHREFFFSMKDSFRKAFRVTDKELKLHRNIDSICSGSTAVTLIKQGQDLIVGNLGDSRAVLGTRDQNGRLVAHQLTVDLKPDHPREARRIKRCNGRVFAHQDEPDVARLWLPNCNSPGLAMARAFGDFCLKDFGLICVPEVTYRQITEKDEFIVLATDGVWDVLTNQEVVDVVASCSDRSFAARSVVDLANQAWRFKYPTSKTDDCAIICLFLDKEDSSPGGLSGSSLTSKGIGSSQRAPVRSRKARLSSKRVIPEDADDGSDSNVSGDERSLESFTRLNTLLTLPKFGDTSPTKK